MRRKLFGALGLAMLLASTTACGSDSGGDSGSAGGSSPSPTEHHGPPQAFEPTSQVALPAEADVRAEAGTATYDYLKRPVTLLGETAYIAGPDSLQIFDLGQGQVTQRIEPQHPSLVTLDSAQIEGNPARAPLVAEVDGESAVLVPFAISIPGQGTTAERHAIELVAVSTAHHEVLWRHDIEVQEGLGWPPPHNLSVVGTAKGTAVLVLIDGYDNAVTYGIDLDKRQVVWDKPDFAASSVHSDVTVGITMDSSLWHAAGRDVADGAERWASPDTFDEPINEVYEPAIQPAGPDWALVTASGTTSGEELATLLDPLTGKTKWTAEDGFSFGMRCLYDDASVVVCSRYGDDLSAIGMNAETAEITWRLPDEAANRVAPTITAAWHGLVYAETLDGKVILDGRTGTDEVLDPGIAPWIVNDRVGIAPADSDDGLLVHQATG